MSGRRTVVNICVCCGCMALAIAFFWPAHPLSEPEYDGRKLSDWLDYYNKPSRDWEHQDHAVTALRHIGTNALPLLLEWIRNEPSPWRIKLNGTLGRLPTAIKNTSFVSSLRQTSPDRTSPAVLGVGVLKSEAAPIVPELTRLLNQTSSRR